MEVSAKNKSINQSSTQRVYLTLRNEIITGNLIPGEKLKIDAIKDKHGTGASPIREALSLLTSDHLVERIDQRGFRVAQTSRLQFQEILNLRCTLEPMALLESIRHGNKQWEEGLVIAFHYLSRTERSDQKLFEERHKSFHMSLIKACNSPILLKFCGQLYDLNVRYRFLAGKSKGYKLRDVDVEHQTILNTAIDRDFEKTSRLLVEHYQTTGAYLVDLMDKPQS